MALDLIIRGAGSSRPPGEHIACLLSEYEEARVIRHGPVGEEDASEYPVVEGAYELAQALQQAGEQQVIAYGGEDLLALAQHLEVGTIWVTIGTDTHGMREIWRLRGQFSWLASRKLGLLVEHVVGGRAPDTERLLRIGRVSRVLTLGQPDPAPMWEQAAAAALDPLAPEPGEAPLEASEVAAAISASTWEGVEEPMTETREMMAPAAEHAEQALLTRYKLVRDRRALESRHLATEATVHSILQELFVNRFAATAETADAFAEAARRLAQTAAAFSQEARDLAELEARLAELSWLKDELEI